MEIWKFNSVQILLSILGWPVFILFMILARPLSFVFYALFDSWWVLRLALTRLLSLWRYPIQISETAEVPGICWTTDIDYFGHMNNGRYFRDLDFARFDFKFRSGIAAYIDSIKGAYIVMHASTIRYRKSLNFLQKYSVKTRLVYFDDRSFYYEQCYVTKDPTSGDEFISAIALCKMTAVNMSVKEMMKSKFGIDKIDVDPQTEKEVHLFIEMQSVSSARLKGQKVQPPVPSSNNEMSNNSSSTSINNSKDKQS